MKITMGVDDAGRAAIVANVIEALQLNVAKMDIVHVTETWSSATADNRPKTDVLSHYQAMLDNEAKALLETVKNNFAKHHFAEVTTHHLKGFITNELLQHAEKTGADIVAVTSSGKGPLEGIMIGSVARKTAIACKRNVLVVKQPILHNKPLTFVFATDHSPYANRCLDELVRLAPKGIGRIVVTTVYPESIVKAMASVAANFKGDVASWLRSELAESNQQVCKKLKALSGKCTSRIETGSVSESLAKVMKEEHADLLVMGAQGHGFIERMTLGSVSLDQVVKHPHSVLILRVK